jgi:dihydropteroate synthase
MRLCARGLVLEFPRRPLVMGIVTLSVDSFSGDGVADVGAALEKARALVTQGADIIDIGAESARTNRAAMSEVEEAAGLRAFIQGWNAAPPPAAGPDPVLLSINTWRPAVAKEALSAGGHLLNDIGALPTDANARLCAQTGAALLIMHSRGEPKIAHTHVGYTDVMADLEAFFEEKMALAQAAGVPREAIVLDPGIDFAKQRADNLRIFRELGRLQKFGRPILLPVSRKTVIGEVLGIAQASERDAGTVACIVQGILAGASIFRVHNVRAAAQTVGLIAAVEAAGV